MDLERDFQAPLIQELKNTIPGVVILKNDPGYKRSVPDLILLRGPQWAMLECKRSIFAKYQPNQEYYLNKLDHMSFAMMICPENKFDVLGEVYRFFGVQQ